MATPHPDWLTTAEAAKQRGITPQRLRLWARNGLPHERRGRDLWFRLADVMGFPAPLRGNPKLLKLADDSAKKGRSA